MQYVPPSRDLAAFNCQYCHAYSHQHWYAGGARHFVRSNAPFSEGVAGIFASELTAPSLLDLSKTLSCVGLTNVLFSHCANCRKVSVWVNNSIVFPVAGSAPLPNRDMPEEIQRDYEEASSILDKSPRGAAALLRLCIDKLCGQLGDPKASINENIKKLVADGLDERTQKALDAVRVIGNNALHPGQIDITDDRAMAASLFRLLNLIVEKLISEPKVIDEIYSGLPQGALEAIEKRDRKK